MTSPVGGNNKQVGSSEPDESPSRGIVIRRKGIPGYFAAKKRGSSFDALSERTSSLVNDSFLDLTGSKTSPPRRREINPFDSDEEWTPKTKKIITHQINDTVNGVLAVQSPNIPIPDFSVFDSAKVKEECFSTPVGSPATTPRKQNTPGTPVYNSPVQFRKNPPAAPVKLSKRFVDDDGTVLIKNMKEVRGLITEQLAKGTALQRINQLVAPENSKKIVSIAHLSTQGDCSDVYLCTLDNSEKWVLKIPKEDIGSKDIITRVAQQLTLYATSLKHPIFKHHIARFVNYDSHIANIEDMDKEEVENYVRKNVHQGFSFVPFIGGEFPRDIDENSPLWKQIFAPYIEDELPNDIHKKSSLWKQLKEMMQAAYRDDIVHDLKWDNLRVDQNGNVLIIDLYEFEEDYNGPTGRFLPFIIQKLPTFTRKYSAEQAKILQNWIVQAE